MKKVLPLLLLVAAARLARADVTDDLREGDKAYDEGDLKRAASAYDRAIAEDPSRVDAPAYGKRASIYLQLGELEAGLAFVRDTAEKQHKDAPEVLQYEAAILWKMGKKGDAITVAEKAAKAMPSLFTAQLIVGQFYATRDPAKTAIAYEQYFANRPPDLESKDVSPRIQLGFAYLALANSAFTEDSDAKAARTQYAKAVEDFDTLKRKFSKDAGAVANANNGLCAAYTGMGKFDQAITVCEQIVRNVKNVDPSGSVWFNLGKAYLKNHQAGRARTSATEYRKLKPKEAKGYILIGDSYFNEQPPNYQLALENYLNAEKLLRPNQTRQAANLSIQEGRTYRRMPYTGTGENPNLGQAIQKLEQGLKSDPDNVDIAIDLGGAYLEHKQDQEALSKTDRLLNSKAKLSDDQRKELYVVAGKSLYNLGKLKESREHFENAVKLKPKDIEARRGLVQAIELQAFNAFGKQDYKAADELLDQAASVDGTVPGISLDRAVIEIDQGDCEAAQKSLAKLDGVQGYTLVYERLLARTYLCQKKPDPKKAAEHYALADKEVKKVQANLIQAEIDAEWAPLLIANGDLDNVVGKLEDAVQFASQAPWILQAAKRNLAVALYRRGWKRLKEGKANDAASDFERATREPALLKGTEQDAFDFSHALAMLDAGKEQEAQKTFKSLAGKGNQDKYLKAPYNKVGASFFAAYASYRGGTLKERQDAAKQFESIGASGALGDKIKQLLTSSLEFIAYDAWKNGKTAEARKNLDKAAKTADGPMKARIANNRAVLSGVKDPSDFDGLSGVPEAYVNLGIAYDAKGKPREAYDAWIKAKKAGAKAPDLDKWIDSKKRIYGYGA